jgi:hypothetical protein
MGISVLFTPISVFAAIIVKRTPKLGPAEPSPAVGNRQPVRSMMSPDNGDGIIVVMLLGEPTTPNTTLPARST